MRCLHGVVLCRRMHQDCSLHSNGHTFVASLKTCTKLKDLNRGLQLHAHLAASRLLASNPFVGSTLVDMYVKCGSLSKARDVFNELQFRDVVSWTTMLAGYVEHGHSEEALNSFERMQLEAISPNAVTFVCNLKACGSMGNTNKGQQVHAMIDKQGLLESNSALGNSLVGMYAKCGLLAMAKQVFDKLPLQDIVSRTTLITAYTEHGFGEEALDFYELMQLEGVSADDVTLLCCLKSCSLIGNPARGHKMHAEVERKGMVERDPVVGNALVDMYTKCGLAPIAQEVFDRLPTRNVVSWNVLIAGYVEYGSVGQAIKCLELMLVEGASPDALTLTSTLKACGRLGAIDKGQELHADIEKRGLLARHYMGSTLIDMYTACGNLTTAEGVFDRLPLRDVFSWTALIAGYVENGHGEEALDCYEMMLLEGISPTSVTYICSLKACGSTGLISKVTDLHTEIETCGLLKHDLVLGNALVDVYAKCNAIDMAEHVFDKLPSQSVVSWTSLLAGYSENGHGEQALSCFAKMLQNGCVHNSVTYAYGLKACGIIENTVKGSELHAEIERQSLLEGDTALGNALVEMYAKSGSLCIAQEVFNGLPDKDLISWNVLIAGFVEHNNVVGALMYLDLMQVEGLCADAITFVYGLEACGSIKALGKGQELHIDVEKKGLSGDLMLGSALVVMYAKCGVPALAQLVFNKLPVRDVFSWTALISAYADHGLGVEALECFSRMQCDLVSPNNITLVAVLKACASTGDTSKGQEIHTEIERQQLFQGDLAVGNAVVNLYIKCGCFAKAWEIFDRLPAHDTNSWTTLIVGFIEHQHSGDALLCFELMQDEGIPPNALVFTCVLKACGSIGAIDKGQAAHAEVERLELLAEDATVGNNVVNMYVKCGLLKSAEQVLGLLCLRNSVSWALLIAGYAECGQAEDALMCFERMQLDGVPTNAAILVCVLKACGHLGATSISYKIHTQIERLGCIENSILVGNTLIDVYTKFGWFAEAHGLFARLPTRDVVSWNALMTGCAQLGLSEQVFEYFEKMQEECIKPDAITFSVILRACCHAGLVSKSWRYFEVLRKDYGIIPSLGHHIYLIDVLGRTGQIDAAIKMIKEMPCCPNPPLLQTLLCACHNWGSVRLGKQAFVGVASDTLEAPNKAKATAALLLESINIPRYFGWFNEYIETIPTYGDIENVAYVTRSASNDLLNIVPILSLMSQDISHDELRLLCVMNMGVSLFRQIYLGLSKANI